MKALHGLSTINVELTSRCNKSCWMCGRRKIEKDHPDISQDYGDMDFSLVKLIASQLPPGIVVQFHNNGEPLLYPRFGDAVRLFENQIRCVDTNAKLIVSKADEIIDNLDTITISVIPNDPEWLEQFELVREFLVKKTLGRKPEVMVRLLGDVSDSGWKELPVLICRRTLHNPMGSYDYKKPRVIPEIGICLEALHHPAIDRYGRFSACVRFDPYGLLRLGDCRQKRLSDIWEGENRKCFVRAHIEGKRDALECCKYCDYWGIPG